MKKLLFVVLCSMVFAGPASAGLGPTKDVVQPGQGEDAANEYCRKQYSDEVMRGACFMVFGGALLATTSGNGFRYNVRLVEKPPFEGANRPAGKLMKCRAEMVMLPGNNIGWKETPDCDYR